jgi:hypothetical protein
MRNPEIALMEFYQQLEYMEEIYSESIKMDVIYEDGCSIMRKLYDDYKYLINPFIILPTEKRYILLDGQEQIITFCTKIVLEWTNFHKNLPNLNVLKIDRKIREMYKEQNVIAINLLKEFQNEDISNNTRILIVDTLDKCRKVGRITSATTFIVKDPSGDKLVDNSRHYGTIALIIGIIVFLLGLLPVIPGWVSGFGFFIGIFSLQFFFARRIK